MRRAVRRALRRTGVPTLGASVDELGSILEKLPGDIGDLLDEVGHDCR